jgi:hypothetical protein
MALPTIKPNEPYWLRHYVRDQRLTRAEADRLLLWTEGYRVKIQSDEASQVFYQAQAGDTKEAILGFGRLMRECQREAHLANQKTFYGFVKCRLIQEVSQELQSRVMFYLPEHIATREDHHLMQQILDRYGWSKKVVS